AVTCLQGALCIGLAPFPAVDYSGACCGLVCPDDIFKRCLAVFNSADAGQTIVAVFGWWCRSMDRLYDVFSGHAAGRLRLCPCCVSFFATTGAALAAQPVIVVSPAKFAAVVPAGYRGIQRAATVVGGVAVSVIYCGFTLFFAVGYRAF